MKSIRKIFSDYLMARRLWDKGRLYVWLGENAEKGFVLCMAAKWPNKKEMAIKYLKRRDWFYARAVRNMRKHDEMRRVFS